MKKEIYNKIITNLQERVTACKNYLDNIKTTDDLKKLTLEQVIELRTFAKTEHALMDKVFMSELYHIIGMGEMSAIQTNGFIKLIREYLAYRSTVKALSCNLNNLDSLPAIPVKSEYKLQVLGQGTKLTAGPEDGFLETETVATQVSSNVIRMPDKTHIIFAADNLEEAKEVLKSCGVGINLEDLKTNIYNKPGHEWNQYGLTWTFDASHAEYRAKANSKTGKSKLGTLYANLKK